MTDTVRAAGGIVRRLSADRVEVALVHRPRYDDWSFPKGKLVDGESFADGARREVLEETGLVCRLVEELPPSEYVDQTGAPKIVRYWTMEPIEDRGFRPAREVDEVGWFTLEAAKEKLSYERDREVLDAISHHDAPAYLVRHAKAGDPATWKDDDRRRPLSKAGRRQAEALIGALTGRQITRILSSPAVRCLDTVHPLARERGLRVESREELHEGAPLQGMLSLLDELRSTPAVVCAHGDLIPAVVEQVEAAGVPIGEERGWKKGSVWMLEREAGLFVRATYIPPSG